MPSVVRVFVLLTPRFEEGVGVGTDVTVDAVIWGVGVSWVVGGSGSVGDGVAAAPQAVLHFSLTVLRASMSTS